MLLTVCLEERKGKDRRERKGKKKNGILGAPRRGAGSCRTIHNTDARRAVAVAGEERRSREGGIGCVWTGGLDWAGLDLAGALGRIASHRIASEMRWEVLGELRANEKRRDEVMSWKMKQTLTSVR